MHKKFMKGRDQLGDLDVDVRVLLKWVLKEKVLAQDRVWWWTFVSW
jgi:hypothetical protein